MPQNDASDGSKIVPCGTNGSESSNTAPKLQKKVPGVPFVKGDDPRRNLKGRPRSFDEARKLAQEILHRELQTKDGREISVVEAILTSWAKTKDLQKSLIELAFGKVPDKLETILEDKRTLKLHWPHERQDLTTSQNGNENGSR